MFGYTFQENDGNGVFHYPNDYIDDPAIAAGWVSRQHLFEVPTGVGFLKGMYLRLYTTEGVQTFTRITNVVLEDITEAAATVTRLDSVEANIDGFSTAFTGVTAEVAGGFISGFKATSWLDPDGSGGAVTELLGDVIAPGTLATNRLTVGLQQNLLTNVDFVGPFAPNWGGEGFNGTAQLGITIEKRAPGLTYAWPDYPTLRVFQPDAASPGDYIVYCLPSRDATGAIARGFPCAAGERFSLSVRVSALNCLCSIGIEFFDAAENKIAVAVPGDPTFVLGVTESNAVQGDDGNPALWPLVWMIAEAPANAVYAVPVFYKGPTIAPNVNSNMFLAQPMFARTHATATAPSPFSPNGTTLIDGDNIRTGSIISEKIAAGQIKTINLEAGAVTADKISVTDLSALNIQVTSIDIADSIQSSNFVSGVSGWRIQKTGASEFNSIAIRRDLIVDGAVSDNTNQWDGTSTTINFFDWNWRNSHSTYINPNGRIVLVRGRIAFVNRDEGNTSDMRVELLRNGSLIASATFTQRSSVNYTTLEVSAIGADAGTYLMRYRVTSGNAGAIVKDKSLITQVVRR